MDGRASLTQLVPLSELAPGEVSSIRNQIINRLVQMASSELKLEPGRIVARDIRPKSDLDYSFEEWLEFTGATINAYETMSTGTNAVDRWIGIYGVACDFGDGDPWTCTGLKFNIGGGDRAIWELESLKIEDNRIGFSPAGVVIPPNAPYTISRYVMIASAPARIVLRGIIVEPRGKVISP